MRQTAQLVDFFQKNGLKASYRKDDSIVRADGEPPGIFYILEGLVKAYDFTRYGEENLLIIRKEHEVFPLIWAITGQERQVNYSALIPTTTLRVSRESFVTFLRQNPAVLAPLMDMTIEMYRLHSERIINLEYRSVRERVISFLLTMAQRLGTDTPDGVLIEAPLRHQDIASSINASRETATRELLYLVRKGLIRKKGPNLVLVSVEQLQTYLTRTKRGPTSSST
jgi:CRP/FNR family transcriptional regulator